MDRKDKKIINREIRKDEEKLEDEACDFLKKMNPCSEKGQQRIEDVEEKCSSWMGSSFRCMDHDKVVVFIREIILRNMKAADFVSKMNLFVELVFETFPKDGMKSPELYVHQTEVKTECGSNAEFGLRSQVHFNTTIKTAKRELLTVKIFDRNDILGDCCVGETRISLKQVAAAGWNTDVQIPIEFSKGGISSGTGSITIYFGAPFNFLTCGLPTCGMDCTLVNDSCCPMPVPVCCAPNDKDSCCNRPNCANACGCLHPDTCGTCHCPTGEKCCSCNAPDCTMLALNKPSVINCCGCLMSDCCAGEGKGTVGSFQSCGKCGIPTFSMACPCYHWGNCGILPCKCEGGECELMDCTKDLTCNGCESINPWDHPEIDFNAAHVYFTGAKLKSLDGSIKPVDAKFALEFGSWKFSSEGHGIKCERGEWKGIQQAAFLESSKNIKHNNLIVKVMENTVLGRNIGEGEISLVSLLRAGYHHELTLEMAVGAHVNGIRKPSAKFEITCMLQSEHMKPAKRTGQSGQRVSVTGRAKRSSILYQEVPQEISDKLTDEHFNVDPSKNISTNEQKQVIADSVIDEDILVGYQVELKSKSTGKSKGIWVIVGVKKYRFSNTSYEMKNKNGDVRWDPIEKEVKGKIEAQGKPVKLLRKVVAF